MSDQTELARAGQRGEAVRSGTALAPPDGDGDEPASAAQSDAATADATEPDTAGSTGIGPGSPQPEATAGSAEPSGAAAQPEARSGEAGTAGSIGTRPASPQPEATEPGAAGSAEPEMAVARPEAGSGEPGSTGSAEPEAAGARPEARSGEAGTAGSTGIRPASAQPEATADAAAALAAKIGAAAEGAEAGGGGAGAAEPEQDGPPRADTDLVIVTGVSGGGRSTVARALENVGFYVVDNLPQALMIDMAELAYKAGGSARRTAIVLDVRSRAFSIDLAGAVAALRDRGFSPRVVFVDADDEVLIRRFEGVRRPHPLQGSGRLADGIAAERELLVEARDSADVLIDTSHLNVNQLRSRVEELFGGEDARRLRVTVLSFGFKYGLPPDADFVLDARFLPNPFWVADLRDQTGKDEAVSRYVLNQRGALTFVETYARLINATAPGFEREGKRYLTVAVGCTGGKHRSVAIAEELARRLRDLRVGVAAQHRDLGRE